MACPAFQSTMKDLFAGVMAGGKGERLWPLSRESHPKQFLKIGRKKTLIELTVERLENLVPPENIFFITTEKLRKKFEEYFPDYHKLYEPVGKNTAAACAFVAQVVQQVAGDNAIIFMVPADHVIVDLEGFKKTVEFATDVARKGFLVTLGIIPDRPETGYGYIERDGILQEKEDLKAFKVKKFHEKPSREKAIEYLRSGNFYWNSGMFAWRVGDIMNAFKMYMPGLYALLEKYDLTKTEDILAFYGEVEETSIDYGIMEKAKNIAVVEALFDWEDVGSFSSFDRVVETDENENVIIGDAVVLGGRKNIVVSSGGLVAIYGVEDMVVIHTQDVTLVIPREEAQNVKKLLREVRKIEGFESYWK